MHPGQETSPPVSVLLVDDDEMVLRAHRRVLERHGFDVATAGDGAAAVTTLHQRPFDVIVSDVDMPQMSGLSLLEHVRRHDLDVPVVLITGNPSIDGAAAAVEHGAIRYLLKPVANDLLANAVGHAARFHETAKLKRQALALAGGMDRLVGDRAELLASFDRAIDSLWIAYQPIVSWSTRSVYAYEALMRSRESALPHPGAVLDAAERLGRLDELGRTIRSRALEPLALMNPDTLLFVNLHPRDLFDDQLVATGSALAAVAPRIVLEITERASLHEMSDVRTRVTELRKLGFRIAIDDLGAGYAGLSSFALLEPEVVKLDISLVRDLPRHPTKRALVCSMISTCRDLGTVIIAEGIETTDERDALLEAGCDLMQGYLFARPGAAFPAAQL
jgi:EAL domain-containing protein (putative c-di-GMP-specific phosphodiesterase class I)/CheY-like chemotaxis protein